MKSIFTSQIRFEFKYRDYVTIFFLGVTRIKELGVENLESQTNEIYEDLSRFFNKIHIQIVEA